MLAAWAALDANAVAAPSALAAAITGPRPTPETAALPTLDATPCHE
jgi:hypothetical protein